MQKKVAVSQIQDAMKTNLEKIYTLSLISGWNAVVVSPPGWGKTKMTFHMGNYAVNGSGGKSVFLPISPATPPERVTGPIDIIPLKEGVLKINVVDTPYDPTARVVILDEFGRASDVVFDQLIHATNDVTRPSSQRPVFWATSNFIPTATRTEALIDRFALWYHFVPIGVDVDAIVNSDDISTWSFDIPTYTDAMDIRNAPFPTKSKSAVATAIHNLIEAIGNEKFVVNPRRVEAWRDIVFRTSVYVTGQNDFSVVPEEAMRSLLFAYPAKTSDEYRKWQSIAGAVVDVVGTAIEQYQMVAYSKFEKVVAEQNPQARSAFMSELTQCLANCEEELERIGGNDPRTDVAKKTFNKWFRQAAAGHKLTQ